MLDWIKQSIGHTLEDRFELSDEKCKAVTYLPMSHWSGQARGATFLVFEDSAAQPLVIVKTAHEEKKREGLKQEARNLQRLAAGGNEKFAKSIPSVITIEDSGEHTLLIESIVPGRLMKTLKPERVLGRKSAPGALKGLTRWLEAFQAASGATRPLDEEKLRAVALDPIDAFAGEFDPNDTVKRMIEKIRGSVSSWHDKPLSGMVSHGDFCPSNILLYGPDVGVIDFEESLEQDLPGYDLFHFLLACVVNFHPRSAASRAARFEETFFETGPFAEAAARSLVDLARGRDMSGQDLLAVFGLLLMRFALEKIRFARERTGLEDRDDALKIAYKPGTGLFATVSIEKDRCLEIETLARNWESLHFLWKMKREG
ncbi:aminoglycoside phosphotransferase family protein [Acidobacteriota bacterium]